MNCKLANLARPISYIMNCIASGISSPQALILFVFNLFRSDSCWVPLSVDSFSLSGFARVTLSFHSLGLSLVPLLVDSFSLSGFGLVGLVSITFTLSEFVWVPRSFSFRSDLVGLLFPFHLPVDLLKGVGPWFDGR